MPTLEKLDPDVDAFYKEVLEKGNLTDEERKFLVTLVTKDEVHQVFKAGTHATKRFQQEMDKTQKVQKALEEDYAKKLGELDSLRTTLSSGTDLSKKEIETLKAQVVAKEDQIHKAIQKAREFEDGESVLKALGLDSTSPYEPTKKEEKKVEPSFDKEALLKEIKGAFSIDAQVLAKLPFDLMKMSREYFSLTGKELDTDEFLAKIVESKTGDYNQVYLQEYDISNLRAKKQEETLTARLEKEIREKLDKEYASKLLPQEQRSIKESDFFNSIDSTRPQEDKTKEVQNTPLGIGDRQSTVSDAVTEFNKLREKKESAAA